MPKMTSVEVKSKSLTVGVAEYPIYDSSAEAVEDKGDEAIVALINAQVRTNAMNVVRNAAVARPSKKKLYKQARASISLEEYGEVIGDEDAIEALVERKAKELLDSGEATLD